MLPGEQLHDRRTRLPEGVDEVRDRVEETEHAGRLAVRHEHGGDRQTGSRSAGPGGPEADDAAQPSTQPPGGVALRLGGRERVLAVDRHAGRLDRDRLRSERQALPR